MKKIILILLLLIPVNTYSQDFTQEENNVFMKFISTQLGQQDPGQVATVFGQLLAKNEAANDQIRFVLGQYLDGEILKAQGELSGLEAQKAAAEAELNAKIELFQSLKNKLNE